MVVGEGVVARLIGHFSNGATMTLTTPGVTAFNSDFSVTVPSTASSCTVTCSYPVPYTGGDRLGELALEGVCTIFVLRSDPALTIEPQKGMVANVLGEQYRIERVDYGPSWIRLDLRGGAAEGTAGA